MVDTLGKIRRLEHYVTVNREAVDPVVDRTLDKLISREASNLEALQGRLRLQVEEFEQAHAMKSDDFTARFERGELGDATDFIEWASTLQMLTRVEEQLAALQRT